MQRLPLLIPALLRGDRVRAGGRPGGSALATVLLSLSMLAGCVTAEYSEGSPIRWDAVDRLEPGRTTRTQVLEWLGAPGNFSNSSAMVTFLESNGLEPDTFAQYPFTDVFVYQLNLARLEGLVTFFYNDFELKMVSDMLVVLFDDQGVVSHVGVRRAPPLDP